MDGVLDGVRVLDLSWGVAGPMAGMLLADHGAHVTKIEPPGGDPFRTMSGYRVWNRGKRSAVLDLRQDQGRETLHALARRADVLIESFSPGTTERLGIEFTTLHRENPRLVYCSITGYGSNTRDAHRPGYDALVAARTGLLWDQRGWPGGALTRLSGQEPFAPDLEVPDGASRGAAREGPLFSASMWPSLATFFQATTAISAALRAREVTGRGQWIQASLLQGALSLGLGTRQRTDNIDAPDYLTWLTDSRAPMGIFQCADGRWVHHWVPNPRFVLGASAGEKLQLTDEVVAPTDDPTRIGTNAKELVVLLHYYPQLAAAFRKFPAEEWTRAAAEAGVALQPIRSPKEALADPSLLADGCVAEVDDPEVGRIRQVGSTYRLDTSPGHVRGPAPLLGQHTDEVVAEAHEPSRPGKETAPGDGTLHAPLDGITVLDLGLAVAGPYGTQVLADLGATVIKVNTLYDGYWFANHIAYSCNRGKRSIAVNLKAPQGIEILRRLAKQADVVHHNMRYEAAERLGVDYASLRQVNPALIYCHTRAFEHGPRAQLPGNDQTGAALSGIEWEDGGCADGGRPIWSLTSLGDTGNGFLSAIGVIQALYHRDRTGQGQMVDTSILYAGLLNTSYAYVTADGEAAPRPHLDAEQLGFSALYRLYATTDGWICLAAITEQHWRRLCAALGRTALTDDARFATTAARDAHDAELAALLVEQFATGGARDWFEVLDSHGVPCEICSDTYALEQYDDPELAARQWVTSYTHPIVGRLDQPGLGADFSETPGRIQGPPPLVGQHTREILAEVGYDDAGIAALLEDGVIATAVLSGATGQDRAAS